MVDLSELQQTWDSAGRRDPLWYILSAPGLRGRRWDRRAFFELGEREIAYLLGYLDALRFRPSRRRALDFGCGVGRLTQALCRYFERVDGVDIAPSMVEQARRYNTHGSRCTYHLNGAPDLRIFADGTFDLVYSSLVLQHMEPRFSTAYVREFFRVLAPGGAAVFQVPAAPKAVAPAPGRDTTSADGPLDGDAFRARLHVAQPSLSGSPGGEAEAVVRVANASPVRWPALGRADGTARVNLGNHWLDEHGALVVQDDARASLPHDLGPGEEVELRLPVRLPAEPGHYVLELDVVQETVTWFADKGSPTARVPVRVRPPGPLVAVARRLGRSRPPAPDPRIEMHAVPRDAVLDVLAGCGAEVVDVIEDWGAGDEWLSYRYTVTKRAPPNVTAR